MSGSLITYSVFMYLLTLGIVSARLWDKDIALDIVELTGMVIHFLFAPLITPIVLGWLIYEN